MGDIHSPSYSGSRALYLIVFILFANGRDTMACELWSHGLDGISRNVHPTAQVDIPTGTVVKFITDYMTTYGRRNRIIGQYSFNGGVQFTGIHKILGSSVPYISKCYSSRCNHRLGL